jgi:hypothetical protein
MFLLGSGTAACVFLQYHLGIVLLLFGGLAWRRVAPGASVRLLAVVAVVALVAIGQAMFLRDSGIFPGRKLIGAFVGQPSIWPTLRFLEFSYFGSAVLLLGAALALWRLAKVNVRHFSSCSLRFPSGCRFSLLDSSNGTPLSDTRWGRCRTF